MTPTTIDEVSALSLENKTIRFNGCTLEAAKSNHIRIAEDCYKILHPNEHRLENLAIIAQTTEKSGWTRSNYITENN